MNGIHTKESETSGLASAYQTTNLTGGPTGAVLETGGSLRVGVIMFPHRQPLYSTPSDTEELPGQARFRGNPQRPLQSEMLSNPLFRKLIEQGVADLNHGHYKQLTEL